MPKNLKIITSSKQSKMIKRMKFLFQKDYLHYVIGGKKSAMLILDRTKQNPLTIVRCVSFLPKNKMKEMKFAQTALNIFMQMINKLRFLRQIFYIIQPLGNDMRGWIIFYPRISGGNCRPSTSLV